MVYVRCQTETDEPPAPPGRDVVPRDPVAYADPDPELARAPRATPASAYAGSVAFSAYHAAAGGYRLVLRGRDGSVETLPVAPRAVPFDVDLGPGRTASWWPRIRVVAPSRGPSRSMPWSCPGPGAGAIYTATTSATDASPTCAAPAQTRRQSSCRRFGERGGLRPGLRAAHGAARARAVPLRPIALRGASTRLAGGSRGVDGGPGPRAIDQYGRRVGFVWDYRPDAGRYVSEVRLDTQRPRHRALSPEPDPTGG